MPFRPARTLTVLALVLTAGLGSAEEAKTAPKASARPSHKAKKAPRYKLVDLNSATKDQLKKLPGITDELAARIIAGRPYMSKAHLVTHNIIAPDLYYPIKDRVAALQPKAGKR
ncbi:MAG TPA: helix-hairpin-helix domain-containing protein [Geothrix sp.]|nr:helix-hairpin-helix domain-containing protein [Geothrix sp.]